MNNAQPFHVYGTSRVRDESALPDNPLEVIVNEGTGEMGTESPIGNVTEDIQGAEAMAGD